MSSKSYRSWNAAAVGRDGNSVGLKISTNKLKRYSRFPVENNLVQYSSNATTATKPIVVTTPIVQQPVIGLILKVSRLDEIITNGETEGGVDDFDDTEEEENATGPGREYESPFDAETRENTAAMAEKEQIQPMIC